MADPHLPVGAVPPPGRGAAEDAEQLFRRYAERLVRLAQRHLSPKLAARVDGEDVVQSAFRTFFRRHAEGQLRIDASAQTWRLLVQITLRKARAKARLHTAGKRRVQAEGAGPDTRLPDVPAREPGPEDVVALADEIDKLLRGLPALYGELLGLRLQNYPVAEVAARLAVSRQTVYRMLELLQRRMTRDTPS